MDSTSTSCSSSRWNALPIPESSLLLPSSSPRRLLRKRKRDRLKRAEERFFEAVDWSAVPTEREQSLRREREELRDRLSRMLADDCWNGCGRRGNKDCWMGCNSTGAANFARVPNLNAVYPCTYVGIDKLWNLNHSQYEGIPQKFTKPQQSFEIRREPRGRCQEEGANLVLGSNTAVRTEGPRSHLTCIRNIAISTIRIEYPTK